MAHVLTQPRAQSKISSKFSTLGKKLLAIAVSYEVLTYCLATVQAAGLTLPTMVHGGPAVTLAQCRTEQRQILDAAMHWRSDHPEAGPTNPQLSDLKGYLHNLPTCPDGGRYQIVYPGESLEISSKRIVVPEGRLGVRCIHDTDHAADHEGMLSNPYN